MNNAIDMTKGKPLSLLFHFALPLMLGNVFQQLYTMVDTIVVGKGVGVEALASLGAGDWLNWLVLGVITGFTQGISIEISQAYGENNEERLQKSIFHAYILGVIVVTFVMIISLLGVKPVLLLMKTPDNVIGGTLTYLRTMFTGAIFVMAYNMFAAMLRGFGNSKVPLIAMVVASLINICLDLLFIYSFNLGIFGAALATIISQGISALICFNTLRKIVKINFKQAYQQECMNKLISLGLPIAFQNGIISVGGIIVQTVVNGFGFLFVAGFTATNKLYGILEIAAISFGFAISSYTGQNLGAKKFERIKEGIKCGIGFSIITSLTIGIIMVFFGKNILALFVDKANENFNEVISIGYQYLFIMAICLVILYFLHLYRSALQGMGNTYIPMISGIVELVMRVFAALLLPIWMGTNGIFYAEILAWTGAAIILAYSYYKNINDLIKIGNA